MYNLFDAENHLDYTLFGRVQGLKCWFPVNEYWKLHAYILLVMQKVWLLNGKKCVMPRDEVG